MEKPSREPIIMFLIIVAVFIVTVVSIVSVAAQVVESRAAEQVKEGERTKIPFVFKDPGSFDSQRPVIENDSPIGNSYSFTVDEDSYYRKVEAGQVFNYNFATSAYYNVTDYQDVTVGEEDPGLISKEVKEEIKDVVITQGNLKEITIPKIGVKAPILQGTNGDELLDHGWWLYPMSNVDNQGEKIFFCHRRFFGRFDPRTCWNINRLVIGDEINMYNTNGQEYKYKIISTSIVYQDVGNMMRASDKNYIKIITCGAANGAPGGNDYRIVVLAELVQ